MEEYGEPLSPGLIGWRYPSLWFHNEPFGPHVIADLFGGS